MVDELPVAMSKAGVVVAAVLVWEVAEDDFRSLGIGRSVELGFEVVGVDGMILGKLGPAEIEDGGEKVHDGGELGLSGALGDGEFFLMGVFSVGLGPGGDEGSAGSAFVVRAFFSAKRSAASVIVRAAERGVATVIAEEQDEGVFGDAEFIEMVEEVAE